MKSPKRALVIVAFSALVGCMPPPVPATTPVMLTSPPPLRVYTTPSTASLLVDIAEHYDDHGLTFETRTANYQTLVNQLLNHETDYILTHHLPEDGRLWGAPIAQDGISAILHPANGINTLTLEQLRELYQGRISNWRELGGADLPVTLLTREGGSGTHAEFMQQVMGERRVTPAARLITTHTRMIDTVAQTPGAAGYVAFSVLPPFAQVTIARLEGVAPTLETIRDQTYPLRATIYIAGLGEPSPQAQMWVGWLQSPAGQAVISRHYSPLITLPALFPTP